MLQAFVGESDTEKQILPRGLAPEILEKRRKATAYLIYVYHRASIACKVHKVDVPEDGVNCAGLDWTGPTWREEYEDQGGKEFWQVETLDTWLNYEPELFHQSFTFK